VPIRTNRGRAAVYRRLWAWPLRSPRRLGLTLAALVAVALASSAVLSARGSGAATAPPATSERSSPTWNVPPEPATGAATTLPTPTTARSAPTGTAAPPPLSAASVPAAPDALAAATAWMQAWVNHPAGTTTDQWTARLAPYTTDEFLPVLKTVDPANISATKVTGPPVVTSSAQNVLEVDVPTDTVKVHLVVIYEPVGWRVSTYKQAG
jgi:hypothetical protein